jgi:hypothetical protein
MTVTVRINTSTPIGKRIEKQLRRYPKEVQFIEQTKVSGTIPEGYVSLNDGFDQVREHVKSVYKNNSVSNK